MSKTFEPKTFDTAYPDNKILKVDLLFGNPRLLIKEFDDDNRGFIFAPSDAPALALAILEAAGYKEHSKANLGSSELLASYGMTKLRQAVQAQDREESEAEAQAKLEAEALELFNTKHGTDRTDWDHSDRSVISSWLAVARRARELNKDENNA